MESLERRQLLAAQSVLSLDFETDQSLSQLQADGWQVDAQILDDQDGSDDLRAIGGVLELTDDDGATARRWAHVANYDFGEIQNGRLKFAAGTGGSYAGNPSHRVNVKSGSLTIASIVLRNHVDGTLESGSGAVGFSDTSWKDEFRHYVVEWNVDENGQNGLVSLHFQALDGTVTEVLDQPFMADGVPDGIEISAGWSSPVDTQLRIDSLEVASIVPVHGLQGQYFYHPDLTDPVLVRTDSSIDFNWADDSPSGLIGNQFFSARWIGQIESQYTEPHSLIVNADDGARLWVNGQLLIDQWDANSVTEAAAIIDLVAGRRYDIQLEYREATGEASVRLEWSSPSLTREVVPTERLYPAQLGTIDVHQWDGIPGAQISGLTGDVNFPATPSSTSVLTRFETPSNTGDDFGHRVSGYLHPPRSGPYTFYVAADENAELWLSDSDDPSAKQLIASVSAPTQPRQWHAAASQKSAPAYLVAGQKYFIEALHKEDSGTDHLAVGWIVPGTGDVEVIPGSQLSPILTEVRIYSDVPRASEGSAVPANFRVVRDGTPHNQDLTVNYEVVGDAINGMDYSLLSGAVTIPAGQDFVDLTVTPLSDGIVEGDESLVIKLLPGSGYRIGYASERTVHGVIQDDVAAPSGGTSLWNGTDLADFSMYGGAFSTESDPTYGNVIQAVINSGGNPWSSQLLQGIDGPVNKGDILFVQFRTRAIGGAGQVNAVFERSGSPFTKSFTQSITVPDTWTKIQIPFLAAEDYAAGGASLNLQLAFGSQTLQFTDFQLLRYGPPRSLTPETAFGLNGGVYGTAQTVAVAGQTFDFAYEVETTSVPPNIWNIQAVEKNDGVVANGDVMRLEFAVRATSGNDPLTNFRVQRTDDFSSLHSTNINLTSDWQIFSIDVPATDDFDANGLQAVFNAGHKLQTIQIGGFHWTNLSNAVDLQDLPSQFPAGSYGGRGGTDGWRSDADDRIAAERTAPLTINVTDAGGNPLDGALVSLRQNRHAFLFGSAINAYGGKLDPNGNATSQKYQAEIKRLFNSAVMENSHKWPGFLQDRQRGIDAANFADDNDLYLRGHNVIWPSRSRMPASIWTEYDTRVTNDGQISANSWLRSAIQDRIADVLTTFDGLITEWDVVNEPFTNNDVMNVLGDAVVLEWYQQVRDFDPDIQLALNDYSIFTSNGGDATHRASFEYWLGLLDTASLLDVIGVQSHFGGSSLTDITVLETLITDYFTQFGEPIAITEFDVTTGDEQLQADYLRDYLTMSFSQPAISEFFQWGFWQDAHWRPDAALYRSDFSIKPNGQAYEDLVFGRWWTDRQATSRGGRVVVDAFLGDYDVIVQYDGQSYPATVTVDDSGNSSITVNVPKQPTNSSPIVDRDLGAIKGGVAETLTNTGQWHEPNHEAVSWSATHGTVTANSDGTWSWSFTPQQQFDSEVVTITATDARGASSSTVFTINPAIQIAAPDHFDVTVRASAGDVVSGRVNLVESVLVTAPAFAIVGGTGSGLFEISTWTDTDQRRFGEIMVAPGVVLGAAGSFTLEIRAQQAGDVSPVETITINVVDQTATSSVFDALLSQTRSRTADISDATVADWMSKVQSNGAFSDLSGNHWTESANRLGSLAEAYAYSAVYQGDASLQSKLYDAVDYWANNVSGDGGSFVNPAWTWPRQIAAVGYFLFDDIQAEMRNTNASVSNRAWQVYDSILKGTESVMTHLRNSEEHFWGGNLGYRLHAMQLRAVLLNDYNRPIIYEGGFQRGFVSVASFADIRSLIEKSFQFSTGPSSVGLTADGSFSQHVGGGAQLFNFGYGRDWAADVSGADNRFAGTPWGLSQNEYDQLADYILDGMQWQVFRGQGDYLAQGRRAGHTTTGAYSNADSLLVNLINGVINAAGSAQLSRYDELVAARDAWAGGSLDLIGHRALWNHDFVLQRTDEYYVSTKMNSTRSSGNETGNNENLKHYHMGDGTTLVMRTGDEYVNARVGWDWHQLPGTTAESRTDALPIRNWNNNNEGLNNFAGVLSDGEFGIAAFVNDRYDAGSALYQYHTVNANKGTFYFDDAIVGLGAAIARVGPGQGRSIRTTLNQVEWRGDVVYDIGTGVQTVSMGNFTTQSFALTSPAWFHQDGIGYVILPRGGQSVTARMETRSTNNDWYDLRHSNGHNNQLVDLFQLAVDHGTSPTDGAYQYVILPNLSAAEMPAYVQSLVGGLGIEVIENSAVVQAVRDVAGDVMQAVFYEAGSLTIAPDLIVTVDQPALLMITRPEGEFQITVADPVHSTSSDQVTVTVTRSLDGPGVSLDPATGISTITFALSNDITTAGQPVTRRLIAADVDFGDAPMPYPTTIGDLGAGHQAIGPRLGDLRDSEFDGTPSAGADADDSGGVDDEDGVLFGNITVGNAMAGVNIDLQNATEARVDAWIDFDGNGNWEAGEKILDSMQVFAGLQTLNYNIPNGAVPGGFVARVRLSTAGGLGPTGYAADGEVEDYRVTIVGPPTVESVQINGGAAQRSTVSTLTVTFDREVNAPASAFSLTTRDADVPINSISVTSSVVENKTVSVITFTPGAGVNTRASGLHSLADGNYRLQISASEISAVGGGASLAADHWFGHQASDTFFRLFGDADGDRDVDGQDYGRFGLSFMKSAGDLTFNPGLDFDGDGDVDGQDHGIFSQRFLRRMNF